jgi:Tol biopolymer transport system component
MDNDYKWEIYRITLKNQSIKRLTNNNYWDGFPKYTPDNKKIVFSSKRNGSEDIYIMNRNGGGEKVFYATDADENDPQISGNELYFKSNTSGEWTLYRYDLETEELTALTKDTYPNWNPRVSSSGSRLAFARKVKMQWRLYYLDLDKGIPTIKIVQKIEKTYDIQPEPEEETEE